MEEFRKKLQKNNRIYRLYIVVSILCIVGIIAFHIINGRTEQGSGPQSGIIGFFAAMVFVSLIQISRNKKALNDEKLLKDLYIRNTDERNNQIFKEAGKTSFLITIAGLSAATLLSDYYNHIVSATLSCCMGFIMLVYLGVTLYYRKKM